MRLERSQDGKDAFMCYVRVERRRREVFGAESRARARVGRPLRARKGG